MTDFYLICKEKLDLSAKNGCGVVNFNMFCDGKLYLIQVQKALKEQTLHAVYWSLLVEQSKALEIKLVTKACRRPSAVFCLQNRNWS
jgi:hypothetical protein